MLDTEIATISRRATLDVIMWCSIPSAFLVCYVHFHAALYKAILPHLYLVLVSLLGLTVVRIVLHRLIRAQRIQYLIASGIAAVVLMAISLYYGLVLIGLYTWTRVVSLDLITSYVTQLPELMETLGLSIAHAGLLLAVAYACLTCAIYSYIRKFDWILPLLKRVSGSVQLLMVAAGTLIFAIAVFHFVLAPPTESSEPLSLTFFSEAAASSLQGHSIDNLLAEKIDSLEDSARLSYQTAKERSKKNVILIIVDALRPDHMGVYGYGRETTPYLAHLIQAKNGTVVPNVRASCGDSSCGLLSLASSKFLHQFSRRPFTLQQVLRRHGYKVNMILGGDHTNFYGLKKKYGEVDSYLDGAMAGGGYYANDDQLVLNYTHRLPDWTGQPVMIQFHLMSSHVLGRRHDRFSKYSPSGNYALPGHRMSMSREEIVNFYDNGVVQADAMIHELLTTLHTKGYLNDSMVVVTADHGEALGEHGLFAHANGVHEEVLRIPLIVIPYGYESKLKVTTRQAASQVDIAPTILAEAGLEIPRTWSGVPLQESELTNFTYFQQGALAGLIDHRDPKMLWKYWIDGKSGSEYAFNLTIDPTESVNRIAQVPVQLKSEWRLQQMGASTHALH